MIVKKYKQFFEILLLQSGLQIKHSLVKSNHSCPYISYVKDNMTRRETILV